MDHSEQPDQGLFSNSWARWHCTQDLGQEYRSVERKDHLDETRSGGKGLCEGSSGAIETPQRGVYQCQPFFVKKILFFLTLSHKICFMAINHLADRTVPQIFMAFKEIYQYYLQRGFRITMVHADGEFAPLKVLIESLQGGPMVNLASPNEHVPKIERWIRVVKEWSWAARHSLPFQHIPKLLMIHIVLNAVKMLNFFPTKGGISDTLIPKTIMSGETLDYKKHLSLQVGQYCQVHEEVPRYPTQ